jgi:hypothetical protein
MTPRDMNILLERAAALAQPFEAPKLSAVAMSNMDPTAFAQQLERAIARSSAALVLAPPTIIDAEPGGGLATGSDTQRSQLANKV